MQIFKVLADMSNASINRLFELNGEFKMNTSRKVQIWEDNGVENL